MFLVEDPRATFQSRKSLSWCKEPDCTEPTKLCKDLVSDYGAAKEMLSKYPTKFKVLRIEDLLNDPQKIGAETLKFYGLPFEKRVRLNSKERAFSWRRFGDVEKVQNDCKEAMSLWGFKSMPTYVSIIDPEVDPLLALDI